MTYDIVTISRTGAERMYPWVVEEQLAPGSVVHVGGRDWLVYELEQGKEQPRALAKLARYRLRLVYPDGREEVGGFRRYRADGPRLGHAFTTMADALARREALPEEARATLARADEAGLAVELVALDPGEAPDWDEAARYVDALTLATIEDDLLEQCGVDTDKDPEDTWLDSVKERLRADLEHLRADVEGDHDEIQEWEFRDGRVFVSVGSVDDESDPDSGHGWLCRLLDSGALGAAGFSRVRKAQLLI